MGAKAEKAIHLLGAKVKQAMRTDAFTNLMTGLGTSRDKSTFTDFLRKRRLPDETMDALFSQDAMAARVCEAYPDEEMRQGFEFIVPPDVDSENGENALQDASAVAEAVMDSADALGVVEKMTEARVWGLVFGGGVLLLGADDGSTRENGGLQLPLNEKAISRFDHINVLDRRYVHPRTYYEDPTSAKFGQPKTYLVTPQAENSAAVVANNGTIEFHETRMIIFPGVRTTIRTRQEYNGWDISLLERMDKILTDFGVSWDSLAHMLQDASQAVFKMDGFIDALAADEENVVMKRLATMDISRSIIRAVVIDNGTEEFERQNFNWTGIKEPFELLILRLSSAAKLPVTRLMGQSPAGMDATGESDDRMFYDEARSTQQKIVKPRLERILKLIMLDKSGPTGGVLPDSWSVSFPSLWQPTPLQQAQIEKTYADKDAVEIGSSMITPEEAAVSRHTADGWSNKTMIDLESRRAMMEADLSLDPEMGVDPDGDDDDVQKSALAGGQTAQLVDIATKVQNGTITQESGVAIAMASYPELEPEAVTAAIGDVDPAKVAAKEALANALPASGAPSNKPSDEPTE